MVNSEKTAISIIIPAYNEERGIPGVIKELLSIGEHSFEFEIIVVDDGSRDMTAEAVRCFPEVNLIQHATNRGYGAALKSGVRHAVHDIICITDADGTYPNQRIPDLVRALIDRRCCMVVGSRTGENVNIPLIRRRPSGH